MDNPTVSKVTNLTQFNGTDEPHSRSIETRNFRMHPDLLWSVIQAQAGVREKALAEAIMNAIDAVATECHIHIDGEGYEVRDDGRGFTVRKEIEDFFETFGTPHKEGDATYGKFRMGRGQLFAFSRTSWRSGRFGMEVDIKANGLSYVLRDDLDDAKGCAITGSWYERCNISEVVRTVHELTDLVQWMGITGVAIFINDRKVDKDLAAQSWTIETEDAYINVKTAGGLAVYNLGALVRVYPPHQFGVCGTIVSKKQLQVNFARNDILLANCKVWRRIRGELDRLAGKLVKKRSLDDFERDAIAKKLICGELSYDDCATVRLVTDARGRKRSLNDLTKARRICVASTSKDWLIAERVMEQELAFVIRAETLHRFNVDSLAEWVGRLRSLVNMTPEQEMGYRIAKESDDFRAKASLRGCAPHHGLFDHLEIVELSTVSAHIQDTYEILDAKALSPHQRAMHVAFQDVSVVMAERIRSYRFDILPTTDKDRMRQRIKQDDRGRWYNSQAYKSLCHTRSILLGTSDVAEMWTDGDSYISINIELIKRVIDNQTSVMTALAILLHEYCHTGTDQGGHVHSPEFFETFHELVCETGILDLARYVLLNTYTKAIMAEGRKPRASLLSDMAADEKANIGTSKASTLADPGLSSDGN